MSVKNTSTTADYLPWDVMLTLIRRLFKDGDYRFSLLIGCGSFFGLRIGDLLRLRWDMILENGSFDIKEHKTKKFRTVRINPDFQDHIKDCYRALRINDPHELCFLSPRGNGNVYTVQRINVHLKEIKSKYKLKIQHFSSHSLRKTFGRKIVESAGENAEMALIMLSEIFNHSSVQITRRYLGLRQQELQGIYDNLDF